MRNLRTIALSCAALLWAGAAQAGFVTVNFDSLTGMGNVVGNPVPAGSQLSNLSVTDGPLTSNLTFSTTGGNAYVAVVALGSTPPHAPSPPNGIGAAVGGNLTYPNSTNEISVAFSVLTNSVSITGDLIAQPLGSTISLQAFDSSHSSLGIVTQADTGSGVPLTFTSGSFNIASVQFWSTPTPSTNPSSVAFDNLTFNLSVVPEPTSVVMGLSGFVGVLGMVRRQRRLARNASAV